VSVDLPVTLEGAEVARVNADIHLDALLPDSGMVLLPHARVAVRERSSGATLLGFGLPFPTGVQLEIDGNPWIARIDSLLDSPLDVAVAAPLAPYVSPFAGAATRGLVALAIVAALTLLFAGIQSARLAGSIRHLATAARTVASGDLTRSVEPQGPIELRQLSSSFNSMTDSLRQMVREVSDRRALAAIGEFATEQSHEIRNALTSVQLYLERVDERSEDDRNKELLARTLAHVRRLDATVSGSLRIARSGRLEPAVVDMRDVVREAVRRAGPNFMSVGAQLIAPTLDFPVPVRGDAESLQQLLLNVLLNAQQALASGGETVVLMETKDKQAIVSIADNGKGMTREQAGRAFESFYTTRSNGTGLGLSIARQISTAHGGTLSIERTGPEGTTVLLKIPLA
jgi:signal transduction histidine kinase